jgi:hypothetical protein
MKRIVLFAVAGLVVGLGGGTGYAMLAKPAPVAAALDSAADSLAADPLAADSLAHGDLAVAAAAGDTSAVAGAHMLAIDSTYRGPGAAGQVLPAAQRTGAGPTSSPIAAAPDTTTLRLARIFGSMKPAEAAAVLSKLDDADVEAVLFQLTDRKAAAILANFPGERAAKLTRTILINARAH